MDCDRIAPWYATCEYLAFGSRLQRHRVRFLHIASKCRRALVLGDGDGRFLKELAHVSPELRIDAVELSEKMIRLARKHLENRVSFLAGDARTVEYPDTRYNLVATHFFLDCLQEDDVSRLVDKVAGCCEPGAFWIVSEFNQPQSGWRAFHARIWLKLMYLFFRWSTGLRTAKLPNYRPIFKQNGLKLLSKDASMGDLVCSELWQFAPEALVN